ncbi:MAG: GntR family transcriptional regulator [Isosphaeraceae bacterium]
MSEVVIGLSSPPKLEGTSERLDKMQNLQMASHKTKTEIALEGLRFAILRGEFDEGRRMTLSDLQDALDMSSTPIREAIRILETEGLLTSEPHRGVKVSSLTLEGAAELYMLRAPLEKLAGELAAQNISDQEITRLEQLQIPFERAASSQNDELMTHINADFHTVIYSATNTQYLQKLIIRLWVPYHWGARWTLTGREESVNEHRAILEAIRARDSVQAGELLEAHTLRVYRILVEEIQRQAAEEPGEATPVP